MYFNIFNYTQKYAGKAGLQDYLFLKYSNENY